MIQKKKTLSEADALLYFQRVLKETKTKVDVTNNWLITCVGGVLMSFMTSQRALIILTAEGHVLKNYT